MPVTAPPTPPAPTNRYNMFNACYGLQSTTHRPLAHRPNVPTFSAASESAGTPAVLQADHAGQLPALQPGAAATSTADRPPPAYADAAGTDRDWTSRCRSPASSLPDPGQGRPDRPAPANATISEHAGTPLRLHQRSGCADFPEVTTNVSGNPFSGVSPQQEVRGFIDAHTHGMAFEFLGGDVHCGRPWSPYGVTVALKDCPDHYLTNGNGAVMEDVPLRHQPSHDPVGWPTFKDWPAPDSLTHEGTYYKWMERSWRGGQRILVNLLVENNKLCELYPLKRNSCDDMDSIRLQAKDMYALQDYVDAQYGGPGKGWYRIVTDPDQARTGHQRRQARGRHGHRDLGAVRLHREARRTRPRSAPTPPSTSSSTRSARWASRQMELVNKFDNALAGVAGDEGATGYLVNTANTLETGSPWRMQTCNPNDPEVHDKDQDNSVPLDSNQIPAQDALFGAVRKVSGVAAAGRARLPGQAPLQRDGPDRPRRPHHPRHGQAAHDLRPRPHEREGPQGLARPDRRS